LKEKDLANDNGFTLIEIIAVLMILGILAALAIPKYISMADEARTQAAQGAIAEIKHRLAAAQAKYMMNSGGVAPTSPQLFTYATGANGYVSAANLANVGTDFTVTVTTGTPIAITVTDVGGVPVTPSVAGNFKGAGDP
jgi:MSHA pilin protein MshA